MLAILLILRKGCQVQLLVVHLDLEFWRFEGLGPLSDNRLADGQPFQIALPLEQQLFSEAPIYDDLETAKLGDSLSMFMEQAGAVGE